MLRKRKSDESGMVMIVVLMVTIIIMVYSIEILSRGASQVISAEDQVDKIKAEQLAMGAYAKAYSDAASGAAIPTSFTETLNNKTFTVNVSDAGATGPLSTNTITFSTNISN